MGSNPAQAAGVAIFLLAFTVLTVAIYGGKTLLYVLAAALLAGSVAIFLKAKPLENAEN
jgi:hypothetical protein